MKIDFSNLILQKSSTDQKGVWHEADNLKSNHQQTPLEIILNYILSRLTL